MLNKTEVNMKANDKPKMGERGALKKVSDKLKKMRETPFSSDFYRIIDEHNKKQTGARE
jgi:hypothetical protein